MGKSAWGDIAPANNGRHINGYESNAERIRQYGRDRHFISKAEAMTSPEKMKQYEKQMENQRKGLEVLRRKNMERKKMKESLNELMGANYEKLNDFLEWDFKCKGNVIPDKVKAWFEERGVELQVQDCVLLSAIKNAVYRGDIRSIEFIRDTLGEKPKMEIEQNTNIQNIKSINELANALYGEEDKEKKDE